MKKILEILKSKKAVSSVETAVIFLFIMMVFSVVLEYATMYTIAGTTKNDAQRVLDSMIIKNATDIFSSIKNGRSSVKQEQVDELAALGLNWSDYIDNLTGEMGLSKQGDKYYRGDNETKHVFIMPANSAEFEVNTFTEEKLEIEANFRVGRSIYVFGSIPFSYSIPFTITSYYTKKNAISTGEELPTEEATTGTLLGQGGEQVVDQEPTTGSNTAQTTKPSASGPIEIN